MAHHDDEHALVERAKVDPEAFGILYERYVNKIYTYIYYRTNNHQDAEDLTARVFHRALDKLHTYRDRGHPFSAWLYRIAHNLVANWHRDQQKRQTISIENISLISGERENPVQTTLQNEQTHLLLKAISQLPPVRQQLLILKFIEGASNAEIGRILDRSEGAVKSLYHRTLVSLKEILGDDTNIFETDTDTNDN